MLLLQEPTMYMVIAMGEKAGLDKIRIYAGEENDDNELYAEDFKKTIDEERTFQSLKPTTISKSSIPVEIQEQIENIEPSSLLSKPNIEENRSSNLSLLERN